MTPAKASLKLRVIRVFLAVFVPFLVWFLLGTIAPPILLKFGRLAYTMDIDHWPYPAEPWYNEDGVQPDRARYQYEKPGLNVVVLGDAFTEGVGLADRSRAFPARLEERLADWPDGPVRVANFGWRGSCPLLDLRRLDAIGAGYRPRAIVLALDVSDFRDDLLYRERLSYTQALWPGWVFYRSLAQSVFGSVFGRDVAERWRVFAGRSGPVPTYRGLPARTVFPVWASESDAAPFMEAAWRNVIRLGDWARYRGAEFAVYLIPPYPWDGRADCPSDAEVHPTPPDNPHATTPESYLTQRAGSVAFPVRSLIGDFAKAQADGAPLADAARCAWSEDAHERVAEWIATDLRPRLSNSP